MKERNGKKIAVITGGASGIGFAIAKIFVQNDILSVLVGRDATRLKLACETFGEMAGYMACDLTQLDKLPGIVHKIRNEYGKSAIEGMTRAMAVELGEYGIRVNCIAPGLIKTNMSSLALDKDPERKKKLLSRSPLGRLGKPREVADAALFLVSESASYITGVVLPVDGGNSIGF